MQYLCECLYFSQEILRFFIKIFKQFCASWKTTKDPLYILEIGTDVTTKDEIIVDFIQPPLYGFVGNCM